MKLESILLSIAGVCALYACNHRIEPENHLTPFEASDSLETATYEEGINWWQALAKSSPYVNIQTTGMTDAGVPLHLVTISSSSNFSPAWSKKHKKTVVLINNGIHPGEPDGIDASMLFARKLLSQDDFKQRLKETTILIIPFYNVGGALNRGCCSRANQNGPRFYGFRGNARNLDLNRDFIKADSRNAQTFQQVFTEWDPDVYLETHVSNGADYPYTMTYLFSHPDKLAPPLKDLVKSSLEPWLNEHMVSANDPMIPYVNVFGHSPDSGYTAFYDTPRYSTGYTALRNSLGLLTETHMLKPYPQRVQSTVDFIEGLVAFAEEHGNNIKLARKTATESMTEQNQWVIDWRIDEELSRALEFSGYRAFFDTSAVTQLPQLYYDRSSSWKKTIPYFDRLTERKTVTSPSHYLVPKAWNEVIESLGRNGVKWREIRQDTQILVTKYRITEHETSPTAYEGHYYHSNPHVERIEGETLLLAHQFITVPTDQKMKRFIIETLEPESPDSYFNWNFFDEILQQKEWFSSYVFDAKAAEMLDEDLALKKSFEEWRAADSTLQNNSFAQLYHLYKQSEHYEKSKHLIYPVFRIE